MQQQRCLSFRKPRPRSIGNSNGLFRRPPCLARACPRHSAPWGATPASPEHEAGRGPARDVAGSKPAPEGLDRTRGLETGSPAPGETGSHKPAHGMETGANEGCDTRAAAGSARGALPQDGHAAPPPTVCGEPAAEAQTTAAWDLPIGAVGDGPLPTRRGQAEDHAKASWRTRAGAIGGGSAASVRCRRILRIPSPCVRTAMIRSDPS
jgi:hypothetical protein